MEIRPWQRGYIVAHDVSWAAQTGKHLLRTQNVSEQNQKHFLCPGHKICVHNKCCARGQTEKHLCRQQCIRNNVSSFARALYRTEWSPVRSVIIRVITKSDDREAARLLITSIIID